ncbi:S24 family peptidase [Variovorax paradoxus]|uniref:S24 family peptidase n=1 Tax=Variovorax paradoxus TaxID=34073 RepID=UPI0030CB58E6
MEKSESPESPRRIRRRERLKQLLADEGGAAAVARIVDTPRSHLSAITAGSRGLGDALAAKLEMAFNKPAGWFDTPVSSATEPELVDLDAHPDLTSIRKVTLRLQAGVNGFAVEPLDEIDGPPIFFRNDWMQQRGFKPYHLISIKVRGQSMEDKLFEGDMVVINTADTEPRDGDVFAVNYEGEAVIKRMKRERGSWWLSSDNVDKARYPDKECTGNACIIVGRVIHKQSERI